MKSSRLSVLTDKVSRLSIGNNRQSYPFLTRLGNSLKRQSLYEKVKDPRPIKDKKWQQNAVAKLVQFLVQSGFPQAVSVKTFSSPSSKDFQSVFKFLFGMIEPEYKFEGKFEETVPVLLRGLRYPFAEGVNKSNLFTVGSLHAWPTLLAMLIWMVELVVILNDDQLELNEQQKAELTFFEYLEKAYRIWLTGLDDFEIIDNELLKSFDSKTETVESEIEDLKLERVTLERELNATSISLLKEAQKEYAVFQQEKGKFEDFVLLLQKKLQTLEQEMSVLNEEMTQSQETMERLTVENKRLTKVVDQQELSPSDVERMTTERDTLGKNIKLVNQRLDDLNSQVWDKEISIQKTMDSLEKLVEKFNSGLYKLDLIGNTEKEFASLRGEIELFLIETKPKDMVNQDLKGKVRPAIEAKIATCKKQINRILNSKIGLQKELDTLNLSAEDKLGMIQDLEQNIELNNEKYAMEKTRISANLINSAKEIEDLERKNQNLNVEASALVQQSQQRLYKATRRFEDGVKRLHQDRDVIMDKLVKALEMVFKYDQHISNSLEQVEQFSFTSLEQLR